MKTTDIKLKRDQLKLSWEVKDPDLKKSEVLSYRHSKHSLKRTCQRNISKLSIECAIEYGRAFFKQGLIFFVFGVNDLPENLKNKRIKIDTNLVVVIAGDSNLILTCYRCRNPYKHIKKKQKTLATYHTHAA